MQVTLEQVRDIISTSDETTTHVASFSEIKNTSYSYTSSWKSYHIALSDPDKSYLLLVSPLAASRPQCGHGTPPTSITLPVLHMLLTKILDGTALPVPRPVAYDVEGNWPFGWLLLRIPGSLQTHPPISLASIRATLSDGQLTRIEFKLGAYLRALHGITNDSFGTPTDKPTPEPSIPSFAELLTASQSGDGAQGYEESMIPYSWQDTFVLQLEELLECLCGDAKAAPSDYLMNINIEELRHPLTRAIGSFLFDDVDTPSLVWVTGNEDDIIVSLRSGNNGKQCSGGTTFEEDIETDIAYILPTFGRALWGDPLMEVWFLPPGPTAAINKGYFGEEEEGTLILFPRQKTKRLWYTVYLALTVLAEETSQEGEGLQKPSREAIQWAKSILPECIELLKDAPCY